MKHILATLSVAKRLLVVGNGLASVAVIQWLKRIEPRHQITLLTSSRYPGFFRAALPYVAAGLVRPEDAVLAKLSFVKTCWSVEVISPNTPLKEEYDYVFVCPDTEPLETPGKALHISTVEDALVLRDALGSQAHVNVIGSIEGLWMVDALLACGISCTLWLSIESLKHAFDPEILNILISEISSIVAIREINSEIEGFSVVFGHERASSRAAGVSVRGNVAVGSGVPFQDVADGRVSTCLSDEVAYRQALSSALVALGGKRIPLTRMVVGAVGNRLYASCGITSERARESGYDVVSTRISMRLEDGECIVKVLADRAEQRILGIQYVGSIQGACIVERGYDLIAHRAKISDALSSMSLFLPPGGGYVDPLVKGIYSLWRKVHGGRIE